MNFLAKKIQQAWQQQAKWLIIFRPLSYLYRILFLWQKHRKQQNAYTAPIPVMIVGNITVGGSGKTPLIIALVDFLQQKNIQVGVISRGYGGKGIFPALVNKDSLPSQVGDEPVLIVQSTHVPMTVGANRQQAIELLLKHYPETQLILSDDGLQHFALNRDIEWVVIDKQRGFGNGKLLPEGFLREPMERLKTVTVIEHDAKSKNPLSMSLQPEQPFCLANRQQQFDVKQKYFAIAGIGYPQRFFDSLSSLQIHFEPYIFMDHHSYQEQDFDNFPDLPIITTSKDAVKLLELWHNQPEKLKNIWVLPVRAKLSSMCYQTLEQQLSQLGIC